MKNWKKESLERIEPKWEACDKENLVERDPNGQINNWMVKERSEFILMWKKGFNDQKRPKIEKRPKKIGLIRMVHFGLRENSYEKRRCFFWLLVRVHSVDMSIFWKSTIARLNFEIFFQRIFFKFSGDLWGIKILDGFQANRKIELVGWITWEPDEIRRDLVCTVKLWSNFRFWNPVYV